MKSRAARVRAIQVSALAALIGGAVHPTVLSNESQDVRQEWLGSVPVPRQATAGVNVDVRSNDGASINAAGSPSERAWSPRPTEPERESKAGASFELDLWTMLAGLLGWMLFVAMRRL